MLEKAAPKAFRRLFSPALTDNGAEFADCAESSAPRSTRPPGGARSTTATRASPSRRGGCERNHVELRKILAQGRGISFDGLAGRDCAVLMSHLNSEPRPSLGGMCAIDMLLAALGDDGRALLDALGVEKVPYGDDMSVGAIEAARRERGEAAGTVAPAAKPNRQGPPARPDKSETRPGRAGGAMPRTQLNISFYRNPSRIDPGKRRTALARPSC